MDICLWAIPAGLIGGRIYHVITDPELYILPGRNPWNALAIWDGGLGIWGAVAFGCAGAGIGCRRLKVSFVAFLDAVAPGVLFAQSLGRWGNWFNNELYGDPSTLPWKLQIHQMDPASGIAATDASGAPVVLGFFEPTFLYESLWCVWRVTSSSAQSPLTVVSGSPWTLSAELVLSASPTRSTPPPPPDASSST